MAIKIPSDTKKHSVPNNSDLFGTLHYTKSICLDEEGYIKLSSRAVSLFNEGDFANLRVPVAFGRGSLVAGAVDFAETQAGQKGYLFRIREIEGDISLTENAISPPTSTEDSHGCFFNNLWHVTDDTKLYSKATIGSAGAYTSRDTSLTSGKVHALELFRNRNTICVTDANVVKQFDTSYSAGTSLTIPTDFEAMKLAYSNNKMAVLANPSDSAVERNQEAYFFVWNGSTTSADLGVPLGSDMGIDVVGYQGSWLVLTRSGQLRFFTGGGWQDLGALPFYYKQIIWGLAGTRTHLGDVMLVEGNVVYFDFNGLLNQYGESLEQYLVNNPGGILCFDPQIGFYHRYASSISPASMLQVASGDINTATNVMTVTVRNSPYISSAIPSTGSQIKYAYDKTNQIGGLQVGKIYYCIKLSDTTFKLATTYANAIAGTAIDLTSTGATNNYFMGLEVYDYGQTIATKTGAMALVGKSSPLHDHLVWGAELNDHDSTGDLVHLNATVDGFDNRGYVVTPKIYADGVEDTQQKVYLRYRKLKNNDKIIIKIQDDDLVGLPVSTPQVYSATRNQCAWSGTNSFSTTADLSSALTAYTANKELECEVIGGAGAGTLTKISSITYSTGTYVVTLAEDVPGAAASRYCDVVIDHWKDLGEVTASDTKNWKELAIGRNSGWYKLKAELRGSNTTLEELKPISKEHKMNN